MVLERPRGASYWEVQRHQPQRFSPPFPQQPPEEPVNNLVGVLKGKSIKKFEEAWKDMVEVQKHEHESQKCTDAANEIDTALEVSSDMLPPKFRRSPVYHLMRRESLENRHKSEQEFQEALNMHNKASYEKGQAETYKEDAQTLEDELTKKKKCSCKSKCCHCHKKPPTTIVVSPFTRTTWNWFAS
ncbi:uncharacterized protein A1O5_07681 [Cladophialophora psammophila CBS 110553]|uniref:Uncharacterized protein n=1 Tax=Cladophialophora psammophila CBS 110553 TaxID=1182543 RepID=W9WUM0_9EURO|nr:uncharacterized protein A1O5_07681 [Cladophialophora psammophila CBS 110553]EXJ68750.1 hypothetical protein A1O5_07681 [Cladophialophora psammophila CBS 110553]